MGVGGQRHALAALPAGKTHTLSIGRNLGGRQVLSGWVRKISPSPNRYLIPGPSSPYEVAILAVVSD